MDRHIPRAFNGRPHAVFLLDAFNAGGPAGNWVTAGNAMKTLAGRGVSVVLRRVARGASPSTWGMDGSKQWATFLAEELPNWRADKCVDADGHGFVGPAWGGFVALTLAA